MSFSPCGINAALDEAKAGIDNLKDKIKGGLDEISDIGAMTQKIKDKLSEVNVPQIPETDLRAELSKLPYLTPEEYTKKVAELKKQFGEAVPDLDSIIGKIPKPVGMNAVGGKDIFADLQKALGGIGNIFQTVQEKLSQTSLESVVDNLCNEKKVDPATGKEVPAVPNIIVTPKILTDKVGKPIYEADGTPKVEKDKSGNVVYAKPIPKPPAPATPKTNPVEEKKPAEAPAKGFTFEFTEAKLIKAAGKNAGPWFDTLKTYLPKYNITTPERVAAFLGTCKTETGWVNLKEKTGYNADYLYNHLNGKKKLRFPTFADAEKVAGKPKEIANIIYTVDRPASQLCGELEPDHGWKYRGRGLIQLTFKSGYLQCSKALYGDDRLCQNTEQVADDKNIAVETSCWFWKTNNLNDWCDKKAWGDVRAIVNSGRPLKKDNPDGKGIHGFKESMKNIEEAYNVLKA